MERFVERHVIIVGEMGGGYRSSFPSFPLYLPNRIAERILGRKAGVRDELGASIDELCKIQLYPVIYLRGKVYIVIFLSLETEESVITRKNIIIIIGRSINGQGRELSSRRSISAANDILKRKILWKRKGGNSTREIVVGSRLLVRSRRIACGEFHSLEIFPRSYI